MSETKIFSYKKYWAKRFGTAPFLPMSKEEMEKLGWDSCDIIIISGDAYVDHPSFGMAIIGRILEGQGFRVGIIAQPNWQNPDDFKKLGKPNLFFGVTSGNMDSMVNRYTADKKLRHDDSYTPNNEGGKRPDRATIVYAQRCREAYSDVPIVLGGIEASLRRTAHYDYWSDNIRRSILVDSKADILVYGNAERAIIEIAHLIANKHDIKKKADIRGTGIIVSEKPEDNNSFVELPSFDDVKNDKFLYAKASRLTHLESNPYNAKSLLQKHGDKYVLITPPPIPLETDEMDYVFDLPYARAPHPSYQDAKIAAWEMIKFSINIMRGCFGGCAFCSITAHEGRIIQNRSEKSILNEIENIKNKTSGFTGIISDLGGPSANMYRLYCKNERARKLCRRSSCLYPKICKNLNTDHSHLINLYKKARMVSGIKKIFIASGIRYDLAVKSPTYIKELVRHHVGGYLKIAPEHTEENTLSLMLKPGIACYDKFKSMFTTFAKEAGKEYYLIPYFIAAHPGTTDEDMLNLALWLKKNNFKLDQVQNFIPSPMSLSSTMYYSGYNPAKNLKKDAKLIFSAKGLKQRRLHKAFLRYHDPQNWPMLREALRNMGRTDLIGMGKRQLIPAHQPRNL
ncbi:MAG: YgiQ family radical SAM protein [Alphaproteobacteria bacterium]